MRLITLILLTMPAWALSNAITIHATTAVPSAQVHITARWFAQGEIQHYARPFIDGVGATSWQADVKNRWPDGSVRYQLVAFKAAVGANSSIVVDFRNSTNACHLGNLATCEAAVLGQAGLLSFTGGTWNAEIQASADPVGSTTARSANARTMISAGHFTYWRRGPVVAEVIVEDASTARVHDFGWNGPGCTQPYDACSWNDDTTHRSLHPIFVLTFPDGSGAVKVQYILANYWTTARQDQRFSLNLLNGAGSVFTKSDVRSAWSTWWRKTYWDGPEPVPVRIDFNMPYLRYSKMVPPYRDPGAIAIKATGDYSIATSLAKFNNNVNADFPFACTLTGTFCGSRTKSYPATGGRDDRGYYPMWESHWLYSMNADLFDVVIKNAEYLGSQNIHIRESATNLNYRTGVNAFGLPNSLNARPTVWRQSGSVSNLPAAVGPNAGFGGTWNYWTVDNAHLHTHAQLAYLITGDWYFMQEQAFLAHHSFLWAQQASFMSYTRPGTWGVIPALESNHRMMGWLSWNIWRGSLLVPDGDPQQTYLREKLDDGLAILEGYWNITDGQHYEACTSDPWNPSTEASRWCWGRKMMAWNVQGSLGFSQMLGSGAQTNNLSSSLVRTGSSPWMDNYVAISFFDMCRTEGRACGIARHQASRQQKAIEGGSSLPRMFVWYHVPVLRTTQTTLAANITAGASVIPVVDASVCPVPPTVIRIVNERIWIAERDLVNNTLTAGSTLRGGRGYDGSVAASASAGAAVQCTEQFSSYQSMRDTYTGSSGYDLSTALIRGGLEGVGDDYIAIAAVVGMWGEDFLGTSRAAEAWRANRSDADLGGLAAKYSKESDPRWWIESDRPIHQVRVAAEAGTATLKYVAPSGAACKVYVGPAAPIVSDDSGDADDTAAGRQHTYVATGLSSGTKHYRISCGLVRASGTFVVP